MTRPSDSGDLRSQIDNALAVLGATPANDVRAVRQTFELAQTTLGNVRGGLDELEAQLDVVTGPERDAVKELVALERKLRDAKARIGELERALALKQAELEADHHAQQAEQQRLAALEKKNQDFENLLMKDDDAFSRYFDKAVEADEKKRGRRPPKR